MCGPLRPPRAKDIRQSFFDVQGREFAQDYRHNFAVFNEDFRILSTGIACIGPAFVSSVNPSGLSPPNGEDQD